MRMLIPLFVLIFLMSLSYGTSNAANTNTEQRVVPKDSSDHIYRLFTNGVMFYSTGNEPFWSLKIMNDLSLVFETMNGVSLTTGKASESKAMDANVKRYDASSDAGSLSVSVYEEDCNDTMSDDKFSYKVKVNYMPKGSNKAEEFSGCGHYIPDYNLSGSWKLVMIGSERIVDSVYRNKVPFIQFNMSGMRVSGIAGCNRINGPVRQEANYIRFTNMAMTMMGCPEEMRENEIVKGLNSTTLYSISGDELSLSNPYGVQLVYKKIIDEAGKNDGTPERFVILNDIWALESINGKAVKAEDFMKGLPYLEFQIKDMKYMGKTGCNNLFGTFEATNETIKFGPAAMTKMMCPGDYEQQFAKALNSANKWEVENLRLYLYQDDSELMVMKKVD
jgi:heat shock protein HslJ